jgi:hypothetical protein
MEIKKINIVPKIKTYEDQISIAFECKESDIIELCLSLVLLKESLSDVIVFKFHLLVIKMTKNSSNKSICLNNSIIANELKLSISNANLEYLVIYFLKRLRDGYGESEHIDIDFTSKDNKEVTLTFKLDKYHEISGDELINSLK